MRQSLQAVCPGKIESSARSFSHRTLIDCLLVYSLHAFNMHLTLRRAITNNILTLTSTLTWRILTFHYYCYFGFMSHCLHLYGIYLTKMIIYICIFLILFSLINVLTNEII